MTFRERYLNGEADFEELFDLTDEWNFSDETCTLREYLGLTEEEEDVWISESDDALFELLEKEKNRKLFLTDLDGTLLNDRKELTDGNRKQIERILNEGHAVCLSTGRALKSALYQAERLGLMKEGCYIIAYNGGQIYDIGKKYILHSESIPMDLTRLCFDEALDFGINIQAYDPEYVLSEKEHPDQERYCRIQNLTWKIVPDIVEYLTMGTPKMLATDIQNPDNVTDFRARLQPLVEGRLDLFLSQKDYLEIVPPGVNKGNALRCLCEYLQIPVSHTIAAGDAENDLQMLKAAEIGVCMINGTEAAKKEADYVTRLDNNHDGVAEILEKYF